MSYGRRYREVLLAPARAGDNGGSPMPYADISDLPASVRSRLPTHAQEIYRAAFNNAWEEYAIRADREVLAHKVAWSAVKKRYMKLGKEWVRK
jgi:cation transport regulator